MQKYRIGACLLIAIAAIGGAFIERPNPAAAQAQIAKSGWDYKVFDAQNDRGAIEMWCIAAGKDGWEMCGVVPREVGPHLLIFKRPKRD